MRVHAVATTYQEADIIAKSVTHLLGNGIERIWIADASTDGTKDILAGFPEVTVVHDTDEFHYQPKWIDALTDDARKAGADWVIPFDADEFWYAQDGTTIVEALATLPETTVVCVAAPFQHFDFTWREEHHGALSKMCFRPQDGVQVANGNHHVSGYDGDLNYELLAVREIMFRSVEHLHEKCQARTVRLDPELPGGDGQHQKDLAAMSESERVAEWQARKDRASVNDPIPYRGQPICPSCGEVAGPGHASYPCVERVPRDRRWPWPT